MYVSTISDCCEVTMYIGTELLLLALTLHTCSSFDFPGKNEQLLHTCVELHVYCNACVEMNDSLSYNCVKVCCTRHFTLLKIQPSILTAGMYAICMPVAPYSCDVCYIYACSPLQL